MIRSKMMRTQLQLLGLYSRYLLRRRRRRIRNLLKNRSGAQDVEGVQCTSGDETMSSGEDTSSSGCSSTQSEVNPPKKQRTEQMNQTMYETIYKHNKENRKRKRQMINS